MAKFGAASKQNLEGVHPGLVKACEVVIQDFDFSVLDGVRTIEEQRKNLAKGVSKTMDSKHLPQDDGLSHAVDAMPYPVEWSKVESGLAAIKKVDGAMEILRAYYLQGMIRGAALALGFKVRQGVDWNSNDQFNDQSFTDIPHTEIAG